MGISVILVVGNSGSGKSSIVRCLTGKSRDSHRHIDKKNVLNLESKNSGKDVETLVLISSLNEGDAYLWTGPRQYIRPKGNVKVHPKDLEQFLDDYENIGARGAILCISTSEPAAGWELKDYLFEINLWAVGSHSVSHTVLIDNASNAALPGSVVKVPGKPSAVNTVASVARFALPLI